MPDQSNPILGHYKSHTHAPGCGSFSLFNGEAHFWGDTSAFGHVAKHFKKLGAKVVIHKPRKVRKKHV